MEKEGRDIGRRVEYVRHRGMYDNIWLYDTQLQKPGRHLMDYTVIVLYSIFFRLFYFRLEPSYQNTKARQGQNQLIHQDQHSKTNLQIPSLKNPVIKTHLPNQTNQNQVNRSNLPKQTYRNKLTKTNLSN